jgi:hypothetical protein
MNRKPNLFIVGAAKSGTNSLRDWLSQHPNIFFCMMETNYFASDVEGGQDRIKTIKDYMRYFRKAGNQKYIGEKSVRYLMSKLAPKKIKKFNPKSKIIIILRNPAEMMFSWYNQLKKNFFELKPSFEKALAKETERKIRTGKKLRTFFYSEIADYYPQVKRYIKEFGKENVQIILFEDMKKNPQKEYNRILKFLSLRSFEPKFNILNVSDKEPKNKYLSKFIFLLHRFPSPLRKFIKLLIPAKTVTNIKYSNLKKTKRTQIDKNLKNKLNKKYKKNIKKLEKLTGKDFSIWLN